MKRSVESTLGTPIRKAKRNGLVRSHDALPEVNPLQLISSWINTNCKTRRHEAIDKLSRARMSVAEYFWVAQRLKDSLEHRLAGIELSILRWVSELVYVAVDNLHTWARNNQVSCHTTKDLSDLVPPIHLTPLGRTFAQLDVLFEDRPGLLLKAKELVTRVCDQERWSEGDPTRYMAFTMYLLYSCRNSWFYYEAVGMKQRAIALALDLIALSNPVLRE